MAYEIKDMTGSLFRNEDKRSENSPNATGRAMINGVLYYVSGWTRESKDGSKWQSLAFKAVDQKPSNRDSPEQAGNARRGSMKDTLNDEIPFTMEWR